MQTIPACLNPELLLADIRIAVIMQKPMQTICRPEQSAVDALDTYTHSLSNKAAGLPLNITQHHRLNIPLRQLRYCRVQSLFIL